MVKEKRILSYFIGWFLVGYIIFIIGSNNVFAATYNIDYNYYQKYFDNNGSTVTGVTTTWNDSLQSYISDDITTASGSYGAGLSITSPIPILENHTYTLSISFLERNNIALSSKNYLAFSSTLQGAANNYANGEYENDLITSNVSNNSILNFAFTARRNGNYIFIPWTTISTVTQTYVTTQIIMEDLGSEGVSINDINSSLTNQTNELNTSIQNSTDTIINNQNQNNEDLKDTINENFNSCTPGYNIFDPSGTLYNGYGISATGEIISDSTGSYYDKYIPVEVNSTYVLSNKNDENLFGSWFIVFYDSNKNFIKRESYADYTDYFSFYNPSNSYYVRLYAYYDLANVNSLENIMIAKGSTKKEFIAYGEELCQNKIDETNDKLDNIEDTLTDSSSPDTSGLTDSAGWLPAGPLDSVLNLPLSLFNALTTNLNKSCNPINIPLPYVNKNITLPCINTLYNQIGITSFLSWIGVIVSGLMLYTYLLKLYKWIEDRISLNETHNVDSWGGL